MADFVKPTVDDSMKGSRGGTTKGMGEDENHPDLTVSQAIGSCLSSPRKTLRELA